MGIAEKLAAAKAATSGEAAAALLTGNTGAVNSVTARPVDVLALQAAEDAAFVKPQKTSADEVLFKSPKQHFGSATEGGIRFNFTHSYLLTNNTKIIAFIRKNAALWGIKEED